MIGLIEAEYQTSSPAVTNAELEGIRMQFKTSPHFSLRNVACERHGEAVVIHGHVESYHLKQLAQECVRQFKPDQLIINALTVE